LGYRDACAGRVANGVVVSFAAKAAANASVDWLGHAEVVPVAQWMAVAVTAASAAATGNGVATSGKVLGNKFSLSAVM